MVKQIRWLGMENKIFIKTDPTADSLFDSWSVLGVGLHMFLALTQLFY